MEYYLQVIAISILGIYGKLIPRVHHFGSDPAVTPVWAEGSTYRKLPAGTEAQTFVL